jgi:UPF0716 protein FxsA
MITRVVSTPPGDLPVLFRFLLTILLAPLAELVVLLWIADKTSWQTAVVIILLGMAAGVWLIRRAGTRSLRMLRNQEQPTSLPLAVLHLIAGLLFLVPGVLSDLLAVGLLIPWTRRQLTRWILRSLNGRPQAKPSGVSRPDRIIDVRVIKPRNGNDESRNRSVERMTNDEG